MTATRLVTLDDVPVLAELYRANREFLAPWEPLRGDEFYTQAGQRVVIEGALARHQRGEVMPHVILDDAGRVTGRINLNDIVRGAFQSCSVGYWVSGSANGRGLATRAVAEIARLAFGPLGLHRIQAGTLLHNVKSQRVLERNGFARIGLAPAYLHIAGRWQDHFLYQLLAPAGCAGPRGDDPPDPPASAPTRPAGCAGPRGDDPPDPPAPAPTRPAGCAGPRGHDPAG